MFKINAGFFKYLYHISNPFRQLLDIMNSSLPVPDLYVYLHREPGILLENIVKRGRSYERGIKKDYLEKIQQSYVDFMKQMEGLRFLVIDLGKSDFVSRKDVFEIIVEKVFAAEYPSGINRVGLHFFLYIWLQLLIIIIKMC